MTFESQFRFRPEEWGLLESVLNEVLNGFEVPDFQKTLGIEKGGLDKLLKSLQMLDGKEEITLDLSQTQAFRNALSEAMRELGIDEFRTRTGYDFAQGNAALRKLDNMLGDTSLG